MEATAQAEFEQAVRALASGWSAVSGGDPNTIDLLHHTRRVEDALRLRLPSAFPAKADGVEIVEPVERPFVTASLIRQVPPATLSGRAVTLVDAINGAGNVIGAVKDPSRRPPPPLDRYYQDPTRAMFDYAFGICPFFRLFGDDSLAAVNPDQITYPPFRVRQMIAIAMSAYFISRRWVEELANTCHKAMADSMIQVEHTYSIVTGEPLATKGLREAWDGTGWRHVKDKLIAHWRDDLRAELLPFTHIELPEA